MASHVDDTLTTFYSKDIQGGYRVAATAMRNLGRGHLRIAHIPQGSTVRAAFLLWDVITPTDTAELAEGRFNDHPIVGTLAGTGGSPCWNKNRTLNNSYLADVSPYVTGNARYHLDDFASGQRNGQDPWTRSKMPEIESATLMVVYDNAASPLIHVDLAAGATKFEWTTVSATFDGFTIPENPSVQTTFIVADGQNLLDGPTMFNQTDLSPSDWQGSSHQSAPDYSQGNLWDTRTYDVSGAVTPGQTSATASIAVTSDCLVWVGQALSVG